MGLEKRRNHQYFYKKVRIGNHVKSFYIGNAISQIECIEIEQTLRKVKAEQAREEREAEERSFNEIREADQIVKKVEEAISSYKEAILIVAGFHNHRGQWRKRRAGGEFMSNNIEQSKQIAGKEDPVFELRSLLKKVDKDKPDPKDLSAVREFLRSNPDLCSVIINFTNNTIDRIVDSLNTTPGEKEVVKAHIQQLKNDYGYKRASSEIEKILIEHVVICWMRLNLAEQYYTRTQSKDCSFKQGSFSELTLSASQNRFLKAVETLAKIRKWAKNTPSVLVNIATTGPVSAGELTM